MAVFHFAVLVATDDTGQVLAAGREQLVVARVGGRDHRGRRGDCGSVVVRMTGTRTAAALSGHLITTEIILISPRGLETSSQCYYPVIKLNKGLEHAGGLGTSLNSILIPS